MSSSPKKRAWLGSLRRFLRRRAPRPSDQEWLRLILLVRKLQRGQYAFLQRLDEVRSFTGVLSSVRNEFGGLQEKLGEAHASLARLEQGLERIGPPAQGPALDPRLEERLAQLDTLAVHLSEFARRGTTQAPFAAELGETLAYLQEHVAGLENLAERLETSLNAPTPEHSVEAEAAETRAAIEQASAQAERDDLRNALRAAELAQAELEAKHAREMTEVADHAGSRLQRLEDDLRTKKRGLSELTQQNITLQTELGRLAGELERVTAALDAATPGPRAPRPHSRTKLTRLMKPDEPPPPSGDGT